MFEDQATQTDDDDDDVDPERCGLMQPPPPQPAHGVIGLERRKSQEDMIEHPHEVGYQPYDYYGKTHSLRYPPRRHRRTVGHI